MHGDFIGFYEDPMRIYEMMLGLYTDYKAYVHIYIYIYTYTCMVM